MTKEKPAAMSAMVLTTIIHEVLELLEHYPPGTRFESVARLHYENFGGNEEYALIPRFHDPDDAVIIEDTLWSMRSLSWTGKLDEDWFRECAEKYGLAKIKRAREQKPYAARYYQRIFVFEPAGITLRRISDACKQLYLDVDHFHPHYVMISPADHDIIYQEVDVNTIHCPEPEGTVILPRLTRLINQVTGDLMEVFVAQHLPQGTVIFGVYPNASAKLKWEEV